MKYDPFQGKRENEVVNPFILLTKHTQNDSGGSKEGDLELLFFMFPICIMLLFFT